MIGTQHNMDLALIKDNLKMGHIAILDNLDEIQVKVRVYTQAKPKLQELQGKLLAHFGQQNKIFFELLAENFAENRPKAKKVEFLDIDLKDVKIKTLLFFDEFPADMADNHPVNFPKRFMDFAHMVIARIKMEEDYLIPLLEEALA